MTIFWYWNTTYSFRRMQGPATAMSGGAKVCANSEIAFHFAEGLRQRYGADNVLCLNMGSELDGLTIGPDDVLVGHIGPWANRALERGLTRVLPMFPWPSHMRWPYNTYVYHEAHQWVLDHCKTFVALCGQWAWEESGKDQFHAKWRDKAHQIALGFSRDLFPPIKQGFNPPGKRGFFYLGQGHEQKAMAPAIAALGQLGYKFLIGNGEWRTGPSAQYPSVEVLGWLDNADPVIWPRIVRECDFVACPTQWDCQPVSPLECSSRGLIPVVTPACCMPWGVPITSAADVEVYRHLQHAPESELQGIQARSFAALDAMPWSTAQQALIDAIESL